MRRVEAKDLVSTVLVKQEGSDNDAGEDDALSNPDGFHLSVKSIISEKNSRTKDTFPLATSGPTTNPHTM